MKKLILSSAVVMLISLTAMAGGDEKNHCKKGDKSCAKTSCSEGKSCSKEKCAEFCKTDGACKKESKSCEKACKKEANKAEVKENK
jgi:hypothetical protein